MKATTYLLITSFKNGFKELAKNPLKLIITIFFILFIGSYIAIAILIPNEESSTIRSINELYLIILGFLSLVFFPVCFTGLKSGATFFSMSDINFLFTSPLKPKTILRYGLIKKIGSSLLLGLFLLFQFFWLRQTYNLQIKYFIVIIICYSLTIFIGQLLAVAIYSYSSFNDKRRSVIKYILFLILLSNLGYLAYYGFTYYPNWSDIINKIASLSFMFIPVSGWFTTFIIGIMESNISLMLLGLIPNIVLVTLVITLFGKLNTDFYEDVIKSTENIHAAISSKREGRTAQPLPTNVKLGKVGLTKGKGASTFFYKHLKESKRSKIFIFDGFNFLFAVTTIIMAITTRKIGILPAFAVNVYMAMILIQLGRWARELQSPYIYLVPEKPFKKLIMLISENLYTTTIYAIILYVIVGVIVNAPIYDVAIVIIGYISFNSLFIAITMLSKRVLGSFNNKLVPGLLHFLMIILISIPGIIGGALIASEFNKNIMTLVSVGIIVIWNTFISLLLIYLSRNLLVYAELNNR